MLLGGLPGWFSVALGCRWPPGPMAVPAQALPGPCGGCSGTRSKPPLTCLPTRQGKNRCFHHGRLRSLNFLPLELLPVLAQWSTNHRAGPGDGAPRRSLATTVNAALFPEVTLCVPPPGPGPALLTCRPLPILFGFVPVWPLAACPPPHPRSGIDPHPLPHLTGPAARAGDLYLRPQCREGPRAWFTALLPLP